MESDNIIQKVVYSTIGLVFLGLIGFNIYQHRQIKDTTQEISRETPSDNVATSDTTLDNETNISEGINQDSPLSSGENQSVDKEADELRYQIAAAEEELDMVNKYMAEEDARQTEIAKMEQDLYKRMNEDPANIKTRRDMSMARLNSNYQLLFKELNLSPEDLDKLIGIMLDEKEASIKNVRMTSTGNMAVAVAEAFPPGDEYQKKIEELLGPENYTKYQAFDERIMEVHTVTAFNRSLDADDMLTDDQQRAFIDTMYEKREKVMPEQDNGADNDALSKEFTEEKIAQDIKEAEEQHEGYIEAARDILSESQIEQLRAYFKQRRDEMELSMRMMAQMNLKQMAREGDEKNSHD